MAVPPRFFFSHARLDTEMPGRYLLRFFEDLEKTVAAFHAAALPLGTIDKRVGHGTDWDQFLSSGLMRDKAFIAVLTPYYPTRLNCGKELGVFLLRSPKLGVTDSGELTGVSNVLPIRWMTQEAYAVNNVKDALIPEILRLVQDGPADDLHDAERTRAIERYRRTGMQNCVSRGRRYYTILLELLALRIREMGELPPAADASFDTAKDAFSYDWRLHFNGAPSDPNCLPPVPAAPSALAERPGALNSLVAFYITKRAYTVASVRGEFSEHLIAESFSGVAAATDLDLAGLFADIRSAAMDEGLNAFHAATQLPSLLAHLASLSSAHVLVAVVIDPDLWPVAPGAYNDGLIDGIVGSQNWRGPVLRPIFDGSSAGANLPPRVVTLPRTPVERVPVLRRVFVESRGEALRTSSRVNLESKRLPLLRGVGGERP
ncbi:hypothetical protein SAMN05444679_10381 [Variovorax sp. CF079]|uniref:toll/interleukin-1 receptor domain-containing protein n=1 Tax=Variovorax sp. CF079 TaxID=1882774 RepID=UPI00087E8E1C|nr:toll/interleukin-1 receptor domain-containing protein [Variovorax sp. CF079]SDC44376.1 hypothetical protein SAMN05444679_10381 [Variovorax sp. CF079]